MDCTPKGNTVDLVDAFAKIGLPDAANGRENVPSDSAEAGRAGDYAPPSFDHLHRYILVSHGRINPGRS
jgi:hypothetical protein